MQPTILNLGCGWNKMADGVVNVDGFPACNPDILWDLNKTPWPWDDNSVDAIYAWHVMEHLEDYWQALIECARILKRGGVLDIRVPDASSDSAVTYRDHNQVFNMFSFNGIENQTGRNIYGTPTNSWFEAQPKVPLKMIEYYQVPFPKYRKWWIPNWILRFMADHLRNFIWEQRFIFRKESK